MINFPELPADSDPQKLAIINQAGIHLPVDEKLFLQILEWIETEYQVQFRSVEVVYVDENEIIRINKEHLRRDYVTDIISFHYHNSESDVIEGTLFCCAPRIMEQSSEYGTEKSQEFYRIFIHGLLHLCGFDDRDPDQKTEMTSRENHFLNKMNF